MTEDKLPSEIISLGTRNKVKVVIVNMSGSYIPLIKVLFPQAKIVLDRFPPSLPNFLARG